ncbi:poly(A) polymerase [Balneicella halophila]|uniref:Poly(A) polymerase n=1 Tax=Balneicella halophila TaxID=1537566 RepID=A0A7L4UR64_BALHA|nr:HD domain-containing protein [Balneicella halophila]PVX52265.1 poly(A) polymerase [Balneicella halophila]
MNLSSELDSNLFRRLSEIVTEGDWEAYVVGGFVRDLFLGRASKDVDIVVVGSGIAFAKEVARKLELKSPTVFKNFGTAMLRFDGWELEFVGARKESYERNSRKPIVEDGTLEDDQNRRDFTINALALSLHKESFGELLDSFGGVEDLKSRIIKTPLDPKITFSDDPLRMMRAIRFATQLNFTIEKQTFDALTAMAERIKIISEERIVDELNKIIMSPKPSIGFKLLSKAGILPIIFPELENLRGREVINGIGHKDNFYHTLEVLDRLAPHSDDLWLRWAALLHDIAKPQTKKFVEGIGWTFYAHNFVGAKMVPRIFRRMRLPLNDKMKFVQKMVDLHMRPIALVEEGVSDSAIRRLLSEAGDDIDKLMTLCEADITSKNEEKVKRYMRNFKKVRRKLQEVEEKDAVRNFQPPVSGEIIMETFNLKPCRAVGDIKAAIKEAILDGEIPNEYEAAYQFMLEKGKELGLEVVKDLN